MKLYEILVPTIYGDTMKPIRTRHHKNWDAFVRKISNGLTLFPVAKGQWICTDGDEKQKWKLFEERVIPVRILCKEDDIEQIIDFTLSHYRQIAVMYYVVSEQCYIKFNSKKS